jgi:ribose/xylose/arabinose/galactoside ABC-type transport system permease subunit
MSLAEQSPVDAPTGDAPEKAGRSDGSRFTRLIRNPLMESSLSVVAFLILFAAYGIWLGNLFLSADARLLDVHQNVPILMLGLAVLVTLVAGLFDLSVAGMATLTTFMAIGLDIKQGLPFGLVLVICLAIGVLGGLINGLLVEKLRVNTFIATLGTGGIFAGISDVYSGGTNLVPGSTTGGRNLPTWFTNMGTYAEKFPTVLTVAATLVAAYGAFNALRRFCPDGWSDRRWAGARAGIVAAIALVLLFVLNLATWIDHLSWLIAILIATAAVLWVILRLTTYGRYLQASGANRTAARLAGVRVEKEVIKAFMAGGFLAALAGVLLAANQGSAAPEIASSFLLPAFAAAFLSTVVFSVGHFTVWGTIIGGIFVVWVSQGLIVGGLPATWTSVVNGAVLIVAVAMSTVVRRSR